MLGVHNGMIIEYDPTTLAPLGMVVSRDELQGRRVAVVDNGYGGSTCLLYDDENNSRSPSAAERGRHVLRKGRRNKMYRTRKTQRRRGEEVHPEGAARPGPRRHVVLRSLHLHRGPGHGRVHEGVTVQGRGHDEALLPSRQVVTLLHHYRGRVAISPVRRP